MSSPDPLIAYLAAHDAPCPGCGYCLRGNTSGECPECGRRLQLHEITYKRPRPSPILVNTLSFFMALPFALVVILVAWLAIDYNLSASWPIAGALILLCVLIVSLFAFPVRRLLMERLMWIVVLNPITLVILLYLLCVGLVLIFG